MEFRKKRGPKVTPMGMLKNKTVQVGCTAADYKISKDFSYFFGRADAEMKQSEARPAERIYPSPLGVSPFALAIEYGVEGTRKMPARDPELREPMYFQTE